MKTLTITDKVLKQAHCIPLHMIEFLMWEEDKITIKAVGGDSIIHDCENSEAAEKEFNFIRHQLEVFIPEVIIKNYETETEGNKTKTEGNKE